MRLFSTLLLGTLCSLGLLAPLCAQIPLVTAEGFAVPQPGHRFEFPRDHGNHPEFKIEWWYVTGHLFAEGGARRFGFQATFFRSAGPRDAASAEANSAFGSGHIFLAHMALLDVQTGKFLHQEKLNREGWDAASAPGTLAVHNGPWSLHLADPADGSTTPRLTLVGGIRAEAAFTLALTPAKPLVVFGENGVSRKGADATAASYYLTFPRLRIAGELALGTEKFPVTGEAWMDHEISSSQISGGQVGWDWLSVQFTDGRELMLYQLRLADGRADPASTLTWIDPAGKTQRAAFTLDVLDRWTSPATGAVYPSRLRLTTTDPATGAAVRLIVEPLAKNQELTGALGGIPYWEGACRIRDESGRDLGSGFLELTGYAKALKL
jgi:predicted secreted hydrolase